MPITNRILTSALAMAMAVAFAAQPMAAQGKGKGSGNDDRRDHNAGRAAQPPGSKRENGPGPARNDKRGNDRAQANAQRREARPDQRIQKQIEHEFAGDVALRGRGHPGKGRFRREVVVADLQPSARQLFATNRPPARAAVGAVARARLRGIDDAQLVITPLDDRVRILNGAGVVLIDLDDDRARNLGRWDVIPVGDEVQEGAPAFCRSGEGHPVFGRQWCIDKRFGLGARDDFRWARTDRITDVVFLRPVSAGSLARDALLALLGPVAFDRLALHAITLGLSDPLAGRWMTSQEPGAPRVLLVSSGRLPVAEIVDVDRDNRADMMVVALRDW